MESLKKRANYFLIGKPGTGKTTLSYALVRYFGYDSKNVTILSPNADDWCEPEHKDFNVIRDGFKEIIESAVKTPCKETSLMVLDDVNYVGGGLADKTRTAYSDLFTRSRHNNLNIMVTGHTAKAVPPVGRSGCTYICAMAMTGREILKELGGMIGTQKLLINASEARGLNKYNCMAYDTTEDELMLINANDLNAASKAIEEAAAQIKRDREAAALMVRNGNAVASATALPTDNVSQEPNEMTQEIEHDRPPQMAGSGAIYTGINMSKHAHNMYDTSRNNITVNNTLRQEQRLEDNRMTQRLKLENYQFEHTMKLLALKDDTYHAICKPLKSHAEKYEIVSNINHLLKPRHPFTIHDSSEAHQAFMNKFYNGRPAPGVIKGDDDHSRDVRAAQNVMEVITDRDDMRGLLSHGITAVKNIVKREDRGRRMGDEEFRNTLDWIDSL